MKLTFCAACGSTNDPQLQPFTVLGNRCPVKPNMRTRGRDPRPHHRLRLCSANPHIAPSGNAQSCASSGAQNPEAPR
jgi:hypothetical protein